jgi:hypothetical protein
MKIGRETEVITVEPVEDPVPVEEPLLPADVPEPEPAKDGGRSRS